VERVQGPVRAAIRAVAAPDVPCGPASAWLGLDDVPPRIARLSSGMIYSLACDQQAVRLPLAAGALAASLRTGKPCALVTPGDPAMFLRKARLTGFDLGEHARSGNLSLFQLAAEADKQMFRAGPEAFLRELELNLGAGANLVVLDQADALFMLSDPRASAEAAQLYLRWVAQHEHTLLALFAPSAMAPREYLVLRRVAENFAGFAVARSSYGGGTLDVRHWFAHDGASPRECFALRLNGSGVWRAVADPPGQAELPPVESVVCLNGAVRAGPGGSMQWQEVGSHAELLEAARRSEAATLVLPFRQPNDFGLICGTLAAVRAMGRPELRVVVRECGRRLRAVHALALTRLGLSSIIPVEISDVGARCMIDLLKGSRFARPYENDLEQVADETAQFLGSTTATSAALFVEAVEGLLAAVDGLDFESCLVRIATDGSPAARRWIQARKPARDTLCLAKDDELLMFVFGCSRAALPRLMSRLAPGRELSWSAEFRPEHIALQLEALRGG
jgi:hypothetical protein